jgi:hypothetical protein
MSTGLYIGKEHSAEAGPTGARLDLDPSDLLTHALIVGMTGSGKTGLAIALLEEMLRQGVSVLAIDPKGDLANLLLLFAGLAPAEFRPWIDAEAARRAGKTVEAAAAETAEQWRKGLGEWGLSAADVAALKARHEAIVYTPGSTAGVALNVLQSLEAPAVPFGEAAEDLRDEIAGIVAGLLGLLHLESDPLQSRESILLSQIIETSWRQGKGLSLETLIPAISEPPFEKLGALPVDTVYPRKDRQAFMMAVNNLLAAPSFEAWRTGEDLDVGRMLRAADGRPRLSVVYTAHLSDEERLFVTALLLDKVKTWMRAQGGTTQLRAVVYMDEIYGYFPPHPANPPPKRPLLTLLKQARAQGVGVVLATQNPVDLDYKGLANMGTWLVGKLQTEQDRERLRDGLLGVGLDPGRLDALLGATRKRVFLLHDVHRAGPCLVHSRWAMSYLRGPLTRDEIERLMAGRVAPAPAAGSPVAAAAQLAAGPPPLPPPLRHHYLSRHGGQIASPHLFVKYAVRYKDAGETVDFAAYRISDQLGELLESDPLPLDEKALANEAPAGLRHDHLPASFASATARAIEKVLKDRLPDRLSTTLLFDPVTGAFGRPGEAPAAFAARLAAEGGAKNRQKLEEKLARKERDLVAAEEDLKSRKTEKWMSLGSAVLQNIGLLTGRKRTVSGAGTVLSKNRMENTAEARVASLQAEVGQLREQLSALQEIDPGRFEERLVEPARGGVSILRYDVVWVY